MLGIYLGTMTNHIKKIGIAGWGFNADYRSKSNPRPVQGVLDYSGVQIKNHDFINNKSIDYFVCQWGQWIKNQPITQMNTENCLFMTILLVTIPVWN